jgi:hypothetical protein
MAKERRSWESDSAIIAEEQRENAPAANAPGPLAEKASDDSTLRGHDDDANLNAENKTAVLDNDNGESAKRNSEATTV